MNDQLFLGASIGEIVVAIITSLIASVVFWLASDCLPKWNAKRKVKPLIDYDLYQVYMKIFFYLEAPFRPSIHRASDFQEELNSGQLTQEVFKTFLSTKCLSEDYRRIDEKAKSLVPIGNELKKTADEIAGIINQLYVFNHYLTSEQILLCRTILDKIYRYSYDKPAFESVGKNTVLHPVDPTLSYMSEVFYELYSLFLKLQEYNVRDMDLSSFSSRSIDTELRRVTWLFYRKQYRKAIRLSRSSSNSLVKSFYFRSLYMMNKKEIARQALTDFLNQVHFDLVSWRNCFKDILKDDNMVSVLENGQSQEEYDKMLRCLDEEGKFKQAYYQQAKNLREHYAEKSKRGI